MPHAQIIYDHTDDLTFGRRYRLIELVKREPIDKGWSGDSKYRALGADGLTYLLRISDISRLEDRRRDNDIMHIAAAQGISMCMPVDFGICDEGVYSLQTWIDGSNAEDVIPLLSDKEQYAYGLEAGGMLRSLHSVPGPTACEDWTAYFGRKLDTKIERYLTCPVKSPYGQAFIEHADRHRALLKGRPSVYQHGDFHIGNMMIGRDKKLYIIDFDRTKTGDPWFEFNRITWCVGISPLFASGMINGYFSDPVQEDFWQLLKMYLSYNALSSIPWAVPYGQGEVDIMLKQAKDIYEWFDGMKNTVPSWYSIYAP